MTGRRGSHALALVAFGAAATAACSSENGDGFVIGWPSVPACLLTDNGDPIPLLKVDKVTGDETEACKEKLVPGEEGPFCGAWKHFLAEPFDSTSLRYPANQLNIRMQSISGGWEFADALFFWVLDSWEVARCMRGRMNDDGTPDWNPEACDRSPASLGPSGEGRMYIGTEGELVTSHFVLQNSCPGASLSADALGSCAGGTCPDVTLCPGRGSWIAFSRFGASQDPTMPIVHDFKVKKDDPIEASAFHVELCDANTVAAIQNRTLPVPKVAISGALDGHFSFAMQPNFR